MLTLRVQLGVASFRKPYARQFRETEELPPPSTCYGFLLSLVGNFPGEREYNKDKEYKRHAGVRICPALLSKPYKSCVVRKIRRHKEEDYNATKNSIPDYQEILTNLDVLIFLDSSQENGKPTLEKRVVTALKQPETVDRFAPICLGESDSLVNSIDIVDIAPEWKPKAFLVDPKGLISLSAWPDYDKCLNMRWSKGSLTTIFEPPSFEQMSLIAPL